MTNRLFTWLPAALLAATTLPTAFAADAAPAADAAATKKELPPIYVHANDSAVVSENDRVGPYNQPEWTTARRFPTTRVYIQRAPGEVAFEQWWRARTYDDAPTKHLFIEELEFGLPNRMQLDLYYEWVHEEGETSFKDFAVELRYALADWGVIPLNPTLYAEYKFVDPDHGDDVVEFKILLGDEITPKLHYGLNFVYEREIGGALTNEFVVAQGLGYTVIDRLLSVGLEMRYVYEDEASNRGSGEQKFNIGPSVQWRLSNQAHLDLVCLFGCTNESPETESYVVFGWDFGGPSKESHYKPTSGTRL
ncbi:hypothetical protein [Roseimicrobium sp. ORNL1]|uniref:hypothetical protein n=1 Tax=Roseimicrobium sp. ORNL1 TaxID=2711231 RepID=UPI0013E0F379|nr:hypothetical protein [Roseimicrobium sp. ORNL1]QIF00098.1 hypothetical protein G5S37_00705 [Roseimicrobium sp. ORNL1]